MESEQLKSIPSLDYIKNSPMMDEMVNAINNQRIEQLYTNMYDIPIVPIIENPIYKTNEILEGLQKSLDCANETISNLQLQNSKLQEQIIIEKEESNSKEKQIKRKGDIEFLVGTIIGIVGLIIGFI